MAIDSIARLSNADVSQQTSSVKLDEFLQLFLTQLNFQDPLEPVDNREFLAQLAQFSSVEISNRINENVSELLDVSAVSQVIGLIGKDVEVLQSGAAGIITGQVTAVRFDGGDPLLTISSSGVPIVGVRPSEVRLVR